MRRFLLFALVLSALVLSACGATTSNTIPTTGSPLTTEDRMLFDDGADYVGDPAVLEGRWRDDWSRELDERVTNADVVAVVRVDTLRTDTDLERYTTFRVVVTEVDAIVGDLPDDLVLASTEGDGGYSTIDGNESRILNREHVLFLRWEQSTPDAPVRARWHLSPHEAPVVDRVEYLAERRRGVARDTGNTSVYVHEQD
ncbi:MAG: hypothetical protein CMN30_21605 [Sandaracinus sp.]|nr:hypothetical protein [Sandaracinus sp.]